MKTQEIIDLVYTTLDELENAVLNDIEYRGCAEFAELIIKKINGKNLCHYSFSMYTGKGDKLVFDCLKLIIEDEELKKYNNEYFMSEVEKRLNDLGSMAEEWSDTESRGCIYYYLEKFTKREDLEF